MISAVASGMDDDRWQLGRADWLLVAGGLVIGLLTIVALIVLTH
jgi:hypothetical protein